ncbi:hypothetical protein ANME2D_01239 [Candidatus Methanoperedens nitroreducens]|uniref:DUF4129 domain-containing protein n=1 Tax=Candidatus Methanoperedens nitratireducens TaxID=1392998 RepID=A0A062VAP8_9EURY|nr:hypothetical protein [Candidatus Methanoperedens nitroreducens]KCZ72804.1 hypothetical protein ANME2D_01239 [Candidatus Methanoperedens nitroreducens]MDJ1423266.1 hypothetical protein [Candidatus Methanoperedens sp.]
MDSNSNLLLVLLVISTAAVPVSGEIPSHINPINATATSDLHERQLFLINELLSYRSGILISLNSSDIKGAQENLDNYLRILQENNNILIEMRGDVYTELNESGYALNLTVDQVNQLRTLYEEGRLAYNNNQTGKAVQIALEARNIIRNLNSMQQELVMEAVAQYPGANVTLYQDGSSSFDGLLEEIQKRWHPVELTLFDDTATSLSVLPEGGEFGDMVYINGSLILPRNRSGISGASVVITIDNETAANITTDQNGRYNYTYRIPYKRPGIYHVQVDFVPVSEPLLASSAEGSFFIKPSNTTLTIAANPDYGGFGDIIHLSGILAAKNEHGVADADIVISLDNETLVEVKTDQNGSYKYDLAIPLIAYGEHTIGMEFVPSVQPLSRSGNTTAIRVMQTNTALTVSAPGISYQQDYLNITGKLKTAKDLNVPAASITILLDTEEIGTAVVNNGDFFFSYWITRNVSLGNHTVMVRFNGGSLFLPSENSVSLEIKNRPLSYQTFLIPGIVIIIVLLYIKTKRVLWLRISAFISAIRARSRKSTETEKPAITSDSLTEAKIREEVQVRESPHEGSERLNKVYAHLEELVKQKQLKESVYFSYRNSKDLILTHTSIKDSPQQTHREFYDLVKNDIPAFSGEFRELTELYEIAMYSDKEIYVDRAVEAIELLKKIYNRAGEK